MHILLTGVSGRLGSHTLKYLLLRGHTITALDIAPLPPHVLASLSTLTLVWRNSAISRSFTLGLAKRIKPSR